MKALTHWVCLPLLVDVMVDCYWSKQVNVGSGMPQSSVFEPVIVPPVHFGAFLENKLISQSDDSTLIVRSSGVTATVAESLSSDLVKVSVWCDLWGMNLNVSKTNTMIVFRSRSIHP